MSLSRRKWPLRVTKYQIIILTIPVSADKKIPNDTLSSGSANFRIIDTDLSDPEKWPHIQFVILSPKSLFFTSLKSSYKDVNAFILTLIHQY